MATLDDSVLERLRDLNGLRDGAKDLRERGRKALAQIPETLDFEKLKMDHDLSGDQWVSGAHPVDLALVVRVLNNQGLRGDDFEPCCDDFHNVLTDVITSLFERDSGCDKDGGPKKDGDTKKDVVRDPVPVLTAARAMHALVGKSKTVFSTATMLCYYQIVRELYLATFPNWIIGAARAGEGGRVSAFVTGECVRAVLAFQNSIRDTITFFTTTKKLCEELERLKAIPNVDTHLKMTKGKTHWKKCFEIEVERIVLDWYAANNLRRNVIALNLSPASPPEDKKAGSLKPEDKSGKVRTSEDSRTSLEGDDKGITNQAGDSVFPLGGRKIDRASVEQTLKNLPNLLRQATQLAVNDIRAARIHILQFRKSEAGRLEISDIKNLDLVARLLHENPKNEYEYYRLALSPQTFEYLTEYLGIGSSGGEPLGKNPPDGKRPKEDELKAALVEDFNENFKAHLVARTEDWRELERRTENLTETRFSKETEWLVERHLGVIKLVKEKKKWEGTSELIQLNRIFLEEAFSEKTGGQTISAFNRVDRRRFDATSSAHVIALRVVGEALDEAERAAADLKQAEDSGCGDLPELLDQFNKQYLRIYRRIGRVIEPARRYIQDVLNRELAHAANSAKFDAGELLFAAASFGAITKWKQNEQLAEARRLLVDLLPEDGRFQTSRPIQSTSQGLQLMPIAFEMTRCFAQLMRKDFGEDLDPKVVRKLLNLFDENPIHLSQGIDDRIGWNFGGAPESQKPSVWVTAVGVFALDRTIRMLNERINAMVLRHFNVDWPKADSDPWSDVAPGAGGKMDLSDLMNTDYELQSAFAASGKLKRDYDKTPHRMDNVSLAIRLQQMRSHLTRAVLPTYYSRKSAEPKYTKAYNAIFYGPPGTGKTTFGEALATTARVPLVRLSPSDLMVQGTDVIESRARAIFDSLSMLTQAVIFLDEFEPVVRTRSERKDKPSNKSSRAPAMPPDPPEFRFLVTGMLPKLTKLNEVAAVQSLVYLLATNHLVQIDDAAKRAKRFDLHLPIYNPDPMSRLLALFYRLISVLKKEAKTKWQDRLRDLEKDPMFWNRVKEAMDMTEEVSAQSLATVFFSPKASKNFVAYVRNGKASDRPGRPTSEQPSEGDKTTPVETDIKDQRKRYEESWRARRPTR